jgi:hypothetical protein
LLGIFITLKILFLDLLMSWNFIVALVIGIVCLAVLVFMFYFPLTVLLGGWDDNSIRDFKKAVTMSGPSKMIVGQIAKTILKAIPRSRLHNRFKYDESAAFAELKELVALREQNRDAATGNPGSKKARLLAML